MNDFETKLNYENVNNLKKNFFFVISKFDAKQNWKFFFFWILIRYDKSFQIENLFFVISEMIRKRKRNYFSRRDDAVENDRFETFVTNSRKQQNVFSNNADFESVEFFKTNVELKQFLISIKNEIRFKILTNREQFSISTENEIWIRAKTRQKQFLTKIKNEIKSWIDHKQKFNENGIFFFRRNFVDVEIFVRFIFEKFFFFENRFTKKKTNRDFVFVDKRSRRNFWIDFFYKFYKFEMKMFRNFFRVCFFRAIQKFSKFKFLSIRFFFEIRRSFLFCSISFSFCSRLFSFRSRLFSFCSRLFFFRSLSWFWKNIFSLKNAFWNVNFDTRSSNDTNSASMNTFLFEKKTKKIFKNVSFRFFRFIWINFFVFLKKI